MTQQILFFTAILIGAFYVVKYGNKAKANIEKFQKNKEDKKTDYLNQKVFYGLKNRNSGFDSEAIYYFSEEDFQIVLDRTEKLNIGIYGIEPWLNEEFYDFAGFKDFGNDPYDANWYKQAFEMFKKQNKPLLYSASYAISDSLL
ncbi:hypothetical protein NAT51_13640 [Flavobacterium amniphilum]|uniref:hypothetical protein n=1 Tax=Flavobacterium amniphilum TaxID=1834035 RepID=UPI00202A9EFB|nr:hypothetical protein [Flavobacterium amniphilum]MCL9806573.1 hypothetical protein [Flavobacterium amniphilum]